MRHVRFGDYVAAIAPRVYEIHMNKKKAARAKTEFRAQLDEVALSQRAFSKLSGVSAVTVNRWCSKRGDALEVPQYARALLHSLLAMQPEQRFEFLKSEGITEITPPPFQPVPPPRISQ